MFESERSGIVESADDFRDDGFVVLFEQSPNNPVHDLKGMIVSKFSKSFSELFFVIVREVVDDDVLFDFKKFESFGHVRIMVEFVFVDLEVAFVAELVRVEFEQGESLVPDCGVCLLVVNAWYNASF